MLLRQKSNRGRFLQRNPALIRRRFTPDEGEQGRLPRSVWSDQAYAIAAIYLQRRILEKDAAGKGLRDLRNREHASGGESRESARQCKPTNGWQLIGSTAGAVE
jgi:hypothetical protein